MSRAANRPAEAVATVFAALAGAFFGRWILDQPSVPITVLVAAVAAAGSLALVELLDRDSAAPATSTALPPTTASPFDAPSSWHQPTSAPVPVRRDQRDPVAPVDVGRWCGSAAERRHQCPACGGFEVARNAGEAFRCDGCGSSWAWRPHSPWPTVAIDVRARSTVAMNRRDEGRG